MNISIATLSLSLVYYVSCISKHKIIADLEGNDGVVNCVNEILKDIYKPGDFILTLGKFVGIHYPVINHDWTKPLTTFRFLKNDIAIINLNKNEEFGEIIKKISVEQFFNPLAKFVVITKNKSLELLLVSSKFYLTDVIFVETVNKSSQSIYTYEPFQEQNSSFVPTSFKYVTGCKSGVLNASKCFGLYIAPKTWKNTTLNVIYNVIAPYFECPTCEDGIESDLMAIISKHLGFNIDYVQREGFEYWGSKFKGNYTSTLEKLFKRECDMVIGAFHSKFDEHIDFDITFSFVMDGLSWLVPRAKKLSGYKKISLIVNIDIYLIILTTMTVISITGSLIYKKRILDCFLVLYQTLLEVALPRLPRRKLLYSHIVIPFLILSTAFKGSLIHVLSIDQYGYQIRTLKDIVTSNLTIILDHDVADYFKSNGPLDKYVYQNYKFCVDPRVCINRTAFDRNVVTVDFKRTFQYQLPILYVDSEGEPLLHLFPTPIFPLFIHWFFVKGYPIFPQIDDVLLKLKSTGIIHHLCDNVTFKAKANLIRKIGIASNTLGVSEMRAIFVLVSLGHILGFIAFLVEVCTRANRKKGRV